MWSERWPSRRGWKALEDQSPPLPGILWYFFTRVHQLLFSPPDSPSSSGMQSTGQTGGTAVRVVAAQLGAGSGRSRRSLRPGNGGGRHSGSQTSQLMQSSVIIRDI